MMNYYVMTLFPEMVYSGLNTSIIGRAMEKNLLSLECVDIRKYTKEKHGHVDDAPYGGGAGMVMQAQPIYDCYMDLCENKIGKNHGSSILPHREKLSISRCLVNLQKKKNWYFCADTMRASMNASLR